MAQEDSAAIDRLPADVLCDIFVRVSRYTGRFIHALTCKKWLSLSITSQVKVDLSANDATIHGQDLLLQIHKFENLTGLLLSPHCSISDSFLVSIPSAFPSLQIFRLCTSSPRVTFQGLSRFLSSCSSLRELTVDMSYAVDLPSTISTLSSLELLRFTASSIPESLGVLSTLTSLHLSSETLTTLPQAMSQLSRLSDLSLIMPKLAEFPEAVPHLTSLTNLRIQSDVLNCIPPSICQLAFLEVLDAECSICSHLPEALGTMTSLKTLRLSRCYFLRSLPHSFFNLTGLTDLELCNNLGSNPDALCCLGALKTLKLVFIRTKLPQTLGIMEQLTSFTLEDYTGTLPQGLANLRRLRVLRLEHCSTLQEIPGAFRSFPELQELMLHNCSSLRMIPDDIECLRKLTSISITKCDSLQALPKSLSWITC